MTGPGALTAARAALAAGRWPAAKALFVAAIRVDPDDADAHDGLGIACWWLNELPDAHDHRRRAFVLLRARGDAARAAVIAAWLGREEVFLNANPAAMRGWFRRAERLLAGVPDGPAHGWVDLLRASMTESPAGLRRSAVRALEFATDAGDHGLEILALAFAGTAAVGAGEVVAGLRDLDEAMTAALAEDVDPMVISEVFCLILSSSEAASDYAGAEHWCRAAAAYAARTGCRFLSAYCRTTLGAVLTATGHWTQAEAELRGALETFDAGHRGLAVHARVRLADLLARQGRTEEAEVLIAGHEDLPAAAMPSARVHLARSEPDLARGVLTRVIASPPGLADAQPLALLVEVGLALDDIQMARAAARQLEAIASSAGGSVLAAQADLALGTVAMAAGEAEAGRRFEAALSRLDDHGESLLAGQARLGMARALAASDRAGAIAWGRAAMTTFERLGARRPADEAAALLRGLGVGGRTGPQLRSELTGREREVLVLLAAGLRNRDIADRLFLSPRTVEHHVRQILSKLDARSRGEAAVWAVRAGLTAIGREIGRKP